MVLNTLWLLRIRIIHRLVRILGCLVFQAAYELPDLPPSGPYFLESDEVLTL